MVAAGCGDWLQGGYHHVLSPFLGWEAVCARSQLGLWSWKAERPWRRWQDQSKATDLGNYRMVPLRARSS